MESLKEVITEVRALKVVIGALTQGKSADPHFNTQVIELLDHVAKDLTPKEAEDLRLATQMLIDQ